LLLGGTISLDLAVLVIPPSVVFFIAAYALVAIYFYLCFSEVKFKLKGSDVLALLILIFIYPYFISFTYSQGYIKEILGVGEKWRRVST
jgi:hypothetical protein